MRKLFALISICAIVTLTACSSGSTNSSLGLNVAGIWRGSVTSRFSSFQRAFVMTIRQAENSAVCDGTLSFEGPPAICFIGGQITNCTFVGSRIQFELTPALEPDLIDFQEIDQDGDGIPDDREENFTPGGSGSILFTANASEDRMEGTFVAVSPTVDLECGNEAGNWRARPRGF